MHEEGVGLTGEYLQDHCPIAWNTPERRGDYAELGFDIVKTAFAVIRRELDGQGVVSTEDLPVGLRLAFDVKARAGQPPRISVVLGEGKRDDAIVSAKRCRRAGDKYPLDTDYLDDHEPRNSCDQPMRDAYSVLGYAAEVEVFEQLLEEPAGLERDRKTVELTVDTTKTAGGCAVICMGRVCNHQERTHSHIG